MNSSDEQAANLLALASILHNTPQSSPLPAERQQELLLKGVVAALEEDAGAQAVELLGQAAAVHPLEGIREQAFRALTRLARDGSAIAVDALYQLAIEEGMLAARQMILTQDWQPGFAPLRALFDWFTLLDGLAAFPESQLPLLTQAYFEAASPALQRRLAVTAPQNQAADWARIVTAVQNGSERALNEIVERYPFLRPTERTIALDLLSGLAAHDSAPARGALGLLFIRHEDPRARDLILEHGYLPDDPEERALFFFMAGDWESYEALDFDHALLTNAYESAGRSLRRRLLEHSRHTGQMDWLQGLGSAGEVHWINDLTDADWELAIRRLNEREQMDDLWRLAQVAPPIWSAAILKQLAGRAWSPPDVDERAAFELLARLAQESLAARLEVHPRKALHTPPLVEITCLAMHPNGKILAGGANDQHIYLWKLPDGSALPSIIGPAPVTRAITFSPDGELIVNAAGDNRIRAFRLPGGQLVKTFEGHRAMIRSLAIHPNGRTLYSAGFDGCIRFWRFPHGTELKMIRPGPGEIFSMSMGAAGTHLVSGGADSLVRVWTLPEGSAARELDAHMDTVTHVATSPSSELAATAGRDGTLRLWNFASGGLIRTIPDPAPVTALCIHPNDQVLIGGRSKGEVTLWNLSTGRVIDRLVGHHSQAITGMVLSPEGDLLYTADSSGNLRVWDMRTFLVIRLAGEISRPGAAAALQEKIKNPNLLPAERKWLTFAAELARWRQRFDIELVEFTPIQVGEFDIEI